MGVGLGVGGCQPFETIQGAAHAALILACWCFWAGKGKRKRKAFLLRLLCLVHIK